MKITGLLCLALSACLSLDAQTIAADFQKQDCAGANHHLYTELDSGYVCLLDFVMFDCSPCVSATNALSTIHQQFEASHPGKVRFYSMGFLNFMSCNQMNNWMATNHYGHTAFAGDSYQVDYYGGMGMPTIVILGGLSAHKVYYNHQGHSPSENAAIINAINLAISESSLTGTSTVSTGVDINSFPNPFDDVLTLSAPSVRSTHFVMTDLSGREILRMDWNFGQESTGPTLPLAHLPGGLYFISLFDENRQIGMCKVVKN